jgi:hypothetical protein
VVDDDDCSGRFLDREGAQLVVERLMPEGQRGNVWNRLIERKRFCFRYFLRMKLRQGWPLRIRESSVDECVNDVGGEEC